MERAIVAEPATFSAECAADLQRLKALSLPRTGFRDLGVHDELAPLGVINVVCRDSPLARKVPILTKGIAVLTERYQQSEGKVSPSERSDANAVQGGAPFRSLVGPTRTWKRKSSGRSRPRKYDFAHRAKPGLLLRAERRGEGLTVPFRDARTGDEILTGEAIGRELRDKDNILRDYQRMLRDNDHALRAAEEEPWRAQNRVAELTRLPNAPNLSE